MKELRIQVEKSEDLKRYLYSTAWGVLSLPVFLLLSCYLFSHIFADGAFEIADLKDWSDLIWFLVCLSITLWLGYTLGPIWWHRYIRRPVLMCFYSEKEKKFYDYKILDGRSAKRILGDMAFSGHLIRIGLPLYGFWQFRWGKMVWHDNRNNCHYWVRISDISKYNSDPSGSIGVDITDGKNFLAGVILHFLPRVAFLNSNVRMSEIVTRLVMSQEQEEKTLKELSALKMENAERYNVLGGVAVNLMDLLKKKLLSSSRLQTSKEAGEFGEGVVEAMNNSWKAVWGEDKQLLEANAAWEASPVKKLLDRIRASEKEDEDIERKMNPRRYRRKEELFGRSSTKK